MTRVPKRRTETDRTLRGKNSRYRQYNRSSLRTNDNPSVHRTIGMRNFMVSVADAMKSTSRRSITPMPAATERLYRYRASTCMIIHRQYENQGR